MTIQSNSPLQQHIDSLLDTGDDEFYFEDIDTETFFKGFCIPGTKICTLDYDSASYKTLEDTEESIEFGILLASTFAACFAANENCRGYKVRHGDYESGTLIYIFSSLPVDNLITHLVRY
jgi:hypothetical protein